MSSDTHSSAVVSVPADSTDLAPSSHKAHIYATPDKFLEITGYFAEGKSFPEIARMPEMPNLQTLYRWFKENEAFRKLVKAARETAAFAAEQEIRDTDYKVLDKDNVAGYRLEFDKLKWLAEVNDSATYGKRATISGDVDRPLVFQISTGVPVQPEKVIEAEILREEGDAETHPSD